MRYSISNTAEYGDIVTGPRIITEENEEGNEARARRHPVGPLRQELRPRQPRRPARTEGQPQAGRRASVEKVGTELRAMMPWIGANKLVDKAKN